MKKLSHKVRTENGCAVEYILGCDICTFCKVWQTSPVLPHGKLLVSMKLVSMRVTHAYMSSGMLSIQCERFCETLGLKYLPQKQATHIIEDYSRIKKNCTLLRCSS